MIKLKFEFRTTRREFEKCLTALKSGEELTDQERFVANQMYELAKEYIAVWDSQSEEVRMKAKNLHTDYYVVGIEEETETSEMVSQGTARVGDKFIFDTAVYATSEIEAVELLSKEYDKDGTKYSEMKAFLDLKDAEEYHSNLKKKYPTLKVINY